MPFNFNLPAILLALTLVSGVIYLVDTLFFKKARDAKWRDANPDVDLSALKGKKKKEAGPKLPLLADYARELFPVFLIVFVVRCFFFNHYRVPSQSLEPTIMPGDFVLVNQFDYGFHSPLTNKEWIHVGEPKTGQIAIFQWPVNRNISFIKRVIGVPGDKISYINKVLYINGKKQPQKFVGYSEDTDDGVTFWKMKKMIETLGGVKHYMYVCADSNNCPVQTKEDFYNVTVPAGHYFMMGDNRDNSDDTRGWGMVPASNLTGTGKFIWMSWDPYKHHVNWERIGNKLYVK